MQPPHVKIRIHGTTVCLRALVSLCKTLEKILRNDQTFVIFD